ncbi:MAG: GatB/YqeY domain-containing protein [Prevotellaceae bacterium]|jgi:uncharacterized protein YqeY|nr:GatB/YqeY domain-containing protein [Prevotellaceae bacterium]
MNLEQQISNDIKTAMLARESAKLEALRAIKAAILLAKTEKGGTGELSSETEIKLLQRLVKQRKESAEVFGQNNRPELADKEKYEAQIIEAYLPKQMSEEEIFEEVKKIIAETGASSVKEMGRVMGIASKSLAGKANGKLISEAVKKLLAE